MKAIEILEANFSEQQINVVKSTVKNGGQGNADIDLPSGGYLNMYGYCTSEAKKSITELTNRQIAGVYSGIVK